MPNTTTNLGLVQPLTTDAPSELRIAITSNATTLDPLSLLTGVVTNAVSATIARGQSVVASPSTTQTLPAATAGALVAVTASSTVTAASPVTIAGSAIYGLGLNNASSFLLGSPGAHVVLQSDGTHWYVIGGQQNTGWVPLTLATNIGARSPLYTPAARVIGDTVTLRGGFQNNTGGTTSAFFQWATVPAACIPASTVECSVFATQVGTELQVVTGTGALKIDAAVAAGGQVAFDGANYSLV